MMRTGLFTDPFLGSLACAIAGGVSLSSRMQGSLLGFRERVFADEGWTEMVGTDLEEMSIKDARFRLLRIASGSQDSKLPNIRIPTSSPSLTLLQ